MSPSKQNWTSSWISLFSTVRILGSPTKRLSKIFRMRSGVDRWSICSQCNGAKSNDWAFTEHSVSFNFCIARPFRREENIVSLKKASARSEWRNVVGCGSRRAPTASSEQARPSGKPRNGLRAMSRFAPFV